MQKRNSFYTNFTKPLLDFFFALILVILLLPLMILAYLLILFTSRGNPIFTQIRIGKNNKEFKIYKFRTLKIDAPHDKATDSIEDIKAYQTWYGGFLRLTHIDEIPQLFNILMFKMSFIGPRPHIKEHNSLLELRKNSGIINLRPGITGLSQISAKDHPFSDEEKYECDLTYYKNISFLYDLKIFFKTIGFVFAMINVAHKNKKK